MAEFGRSLWGKIIGVLTIAMMLIGIYVEIVGAWRSTYDARKSKADTELSEQQNEIAHSNIERDDTPEQKVMRDHEKCLRAESAHLVAELGANYTKAAVLRRCQTLGK